MIKTFCDCCGDEMTESNWPKGGDDPGRLGGEVQKGDVKLIISVMVGTNGTMNGGDLCKFCIFDAIAQLDPRPQVASRA